MFSFGRINGRNLRTEVELAFRNNDLDEVFLGGLPQGYTGDASLFSGMSNVYWEFQQVPSGCFKPYLGLGIGFASVDTGLIDGNGNSLIPVDSGADTSFAYQWMAGINYRATCDLDLFAEYRFLEADSIRVDALSSSLSGNYDYQADTVGFGFRWKF